MPRSSLWQLASLLLAASPLVAADTASVANSTTYNRPVNANGRGGDNNGDNNYCYRQTVTEYCTVTEWKTKTCYETVTGSVPVVSTETITSVEIQSSVAYETDHVTSTETDYSSYVVVGSPPAHAI
jgi:hypothetical protein